MMVDLTGNYEIVDFAYLQMKANANDPRAQFARAVLENTSYSAYLAAVGNIWSTFPVTKRTQSPADGKFCTSAGRARSQTPGGNDATISTTEEDAWTAPWP
jgi:hypothetical protein